MDARELSTGDLNDAFELLANETRLDVLQALWTSPEDSLPFSSLRQRVGVDDSGRFNYHLNELVPQFVHERDGEYELTHAGEQVIGAAVSGAFSGSSPDATESVAIGTCGDCGGDMVAKYEAGELRVNCADCDDMGDRMRVPPVVAFGRDVGELPGAFGRFVLTEAQRIYRGFCPLCSGRIERKITRFSDHERLLPEDHVEVRHECRACGNVRRMGILTALLDHPAVLWFFYRAGVDLRETPLYDVEMVWDTEASVESEDPVRVAVTLTEGDRTLTATVDGSASVVDVEFDR